MDGRHHDGDQRSQPEADRCEDCPELDIAVTLPEGVQAGIEHLSGSPETTRDGTSLHWAPGQAEPGLYRVAVGLEYYVHHITEDEDDLATVYALDDPLYEDERFIVDPADLLPGPTPAWEVTMCVPGPVTVTFTVDDVVAETFTDDMACAPGDVHEYELRLP